MSGSDPGAPYTLYKMDVSYFSGKLEAYLRYKRIAHDPVTADARRLAEIHACTGVKKVPALRGADGRWLFDTTPTMAWLEQRYPQRPATPDDPALAFLAALIEDYADEWLWRPAMWWRWEPRASRLALGWRIADEVRPPGVPRWLMARYFAWRQRRTWLWGDGMDRGNADRVRDLYLSELELLESVLRESAYLFGAQPSLADFGYFASMFRHFGNDPDPAELMRRRAPTVYAWLARLWRGGPEEVATRPVWQWPQGPSWHPLWQRIGGDYLPYLEQNAQAWARRRRRFDFEGDSLSFAGTVTHRYRVWCRSQLQARYRALTLAERGRVAALIGAQALSGLADGADIDSGLDALYRLPRAPGRYRASLKVALLGQPRD